MVLSYSSQMELECSEVVQMSDSEFQDLAGGGGFSWGFLQQQLGATVKFP